MTALDLPLSPKQIASIVESEQHSINIWSGAIRAGKTIASIVAFFIGVQQAPSTGLILICGRTLQTIERNIIEPMQDPTVFGAFSKAVQHTRGSSTATILGRTVHLIGAADVRAEGKLRGLTASLAMVDEATLLPEEFWTQLLGRLSVDGARLYATTNPSSPAHFLKKKFIDRRDVLDVGYWNFMMDDNPSLSEKYKADKRAEFTGTFLRRNYYGEWIGAEGAVYDMFDPEKHVIKREDLPRIKQIIGTGIDYGVTNASAGVMLALGEDNCLYFVDEWYVKTTSFEASWSNSQLASGVIDWLGKPHLLNQPELPTGYVLVDPSAKAFRRELKNMGIAPRVAKNDVMDGIGTMATLFSLDKLKVTDNCERLLEELPNYRWDPRATERGEDVPIKIDDHLCFSAGTLVSTEHGDVPIEQIRPGMRVWTRAGLRHVVDAGMTSPSAKVMEVEFSNGATLVGTPNHPVWVEGIGFRPIDHLRYGDTVDAWRNESKPFASTASNSDAIPTRPDSQTADTSFQESGIGSVDTSVSTKKFGCTPMEFGPSPKATTFTTSTMTTTTTSHQTSNASPLKSITCTTPKRIALTLSGWSRRVARWTTRDSSHLNGTGPKRAENGIGSTPVKSGTTWKRSKTSANSAGPATNPSTRVDFALTSANRRGGETPELMTWIDHADGAETPFESISTPRSDSAPVIVLKVTEKPLRMAVYNLTVSGQHEFYANGILVHNCDSARYVTWTTIRKWWREVMGSRELPGSKGKPANDDW